MSKKKKAKKKNPKKETQNQSDDPVVCLSALPMTSEYSCVVIRRDKDKLPEDKQVEMDRVCQIMQNAIFAVELVSNKQGTFIDIQAYNIEDTVSGKLLWSEAHALIGSNGETYVEIYNMSGEDFVSAERYFVSDAELRLQRDKRASGAQVFSLTGTVSEELALETTSEV